MLIPSTNQDLVTNNVNLIHIDGDLRVNGNITIDATVNVGGDVFVNGNILGSDPLNIAGDLTQPTGATTQGAVSVAGTQIEAAVTSRFRVVGFMSTTCARLAQ